MCLATAKQSRRPKLSLRSRATRRRPPPPPLRRALAEAEAEVEAEAAEEESVQRSLLSLPPSAPSAPLSRWWTSPGTTEI